MPKKAVSFLPTVFFATQRTFLADGRNHVANLHTIPITVSLVVPVILIYDIVTVFVSRLPPGRQGRSRRTN